MIQEPSDLKEHQQDHQQHQKDPGIPQNILRLKNKLPAVQATLELPRQQNQIHYPHGPGPLPHLQWQQLLQEKGKQGLKRARWKQGQQLTASSLGMTFTALLKFGIYALMCFVLWSWRTSVPWVTPGLTWEATRLQEKSRIVWDAFVLVSLIRSIA